MSVSTSERARATCDDCSDLLPNADRRTARVHANRHGHTTRFTQEQTTTWVGEPLALLDAESSAEQRFGAAVRKSREDRDWSQERLAVELARTGCGLTQSGVSRLESGERGTSLNEAEAISELLGIDRSEWQS